MTADLDEVAAACGAEVIGSPDGHDLTAVVVSDVTHDSRLVNGSTLFCCVRGANVDGHDYAPAAVEAGAVALLVEYPVELPPGSAVVQLAVEDVRRSMGIAARVVHGDPAAELTVIGVTGTNGKSSIVQLLSDVFTAAGQRSELVGTLRGPRTTPESTDLQRLLRRYADENVTMVAMEVSSHALELHRVAGTRFSCAIFTNLGRDHLDFHRTMEAYYEAKAKLFETHYTDLAVVNVDDPAGRRLAESLAARDEVSLETYSLDQAESLRFDGALTRFRWRGSEIALPLAGAHNVSNALAAATAAASLGIPLAAIADGLAATRPVRGRFELVEGGQRFLVAVDYAHTPDALHAALVAARQAAGQGRVVLVFGCGGDRDAGKRPEMGHIAEERADVVVVTSDNPRSEDPLDIIADVLAGTSDPGSIVVEPDRRSAIAAALDQARDGDVVLIAGKGHETYQVIGDTTVDFDDRAVALQLLERGQ